MKFQAISFFICLFISLTCADYHEILFGQWKNAFNKDYACQEEEDFRYQTWRDNLNTVTRHNLEYSQKRHHFKLEMNHLADMNASEVNSLLTGYRSYWDRNNPKKDPPAAKYLGLMNIPEEALPDYVNWNEKGYVSRVRFQGYCGSCYAFSATGSLEGQQKRKTGKLIELSQQNLLDCSHAEGDNGCKGGLMDKSFRYIIRNGGIDTYESYPYEARRGPCRFEKKNVGATIVGYVDIPKGNEKLLKEAVATVGPISVGIDSKSEYLHLYARGIYFQSNCRKKKLSHGLLLVGYGTNEDGVDYWIIKNSWGRWWGENGYFRMARNFNNMCGIATEPSYPLVG